MAWASKTVADARELLEFIQRMATAKHVSAVAVNAAGTGYTDGDLLTITHAGAHLTLTFVVGCSTSPGPITSIKRIETNGAFADLVTAATVTAGQAGSGYAVNDIVEVLGGTSTSKAKLKVTGVSGGAVTTLAVFEGGGAYSSRPANGASTDSAIGTGTGTGLQVDLTWSGLIGTTGIAATGGTGTGATFNLTLADTGWTTLVSRNDFSFNSVADEKEVVLQGTAGAGASNPIVGFRTGTDGAGPARVFMSISPMTAFNSSLAYNDQPNILNPTPGTSGGSYVQLNPAGSNAGYLGIGPRYISGHYKCVGASVTAWHNFLVGLLDPFGTATESPYPSVVLAPVNSIAVPFDSADEVDIAGLTELHRKTGRAGPCYIWVQGDLAWRELVHGEASGTGPPFAVKQDRGVTPLFRPRVNFTGTANKGQWVADAPYSYHDTIGRADGGAATHALKPTPDAGGAKQAIIPCDVVHSLDASGITNGGVDGQLPNVFWVSAKKADGSLMLAEDALLFGNEKWLIFPNGKRSTLAYSFCARKIGV